jgi:carbonic anhydrase
MRKLVLVTLFIALPCLAADPNDPCDTGFAYVGPKGPQFWGSLRPAWLTCSTGTIQSPIRVADSVVESRLPLVKVPTHAVASTFKIQNTGHDLKVKELNPPWRLEWGTRTATLDQFHVHVKAEHFMGTTQYDAEIHFVFKDDHDPDALIVLTTWVKKGGSNSALAKVAADKPASCATSNRSTQTIKFDDFPADWSNYYDYHGSLTTPGCDENVNFIIATAPITASASEIDALTLVRWPPGNVRPLQTHGVKRRR